MSLRDALKSFVKRVAERIAPHAWIAIAAARSRAHSHRLVREWGLYDLNQRLIREMGSAVLGGPFLGLRLPPVAEAEHLGPFLLGTYESELHEWWQRLLHQEFSQMLDVGAKFGFYAVGYAIQFPSCPVVAFDPDPWARRATREMAELNATPNVRVEELCDPQWLRRHLLPNAFIVSDCEGYEAQLFGAGDSVDSGALSSATLLIELHEVQVPGVTAAIDKAFSASHSAARVTSAPDHQHKMEAIGSISAADATRLAREIRGPQEWILLRPVDPPADRRRPNTDRDTTTRR